MKVNKSENYFHDIQMPVDERLESIASLNESYHDDVLSFSLVLQQKDLCKANLADIKAECKKALNSMLIKLDSMFE